MLNHSLKINLKANLNSFFSKKLIFLSIFLLLLVSQIQAQNQIKTIQYNCLENYQARILIPDTPQAKKPVIIFMYDPVFDWISEENAYKKGYNLNAFMQEFARQGYISIVPLRTTHQIRAVSGAIKYLEALSEADKNNINLIAISENAFICLFLGTELKKIKTLTLISPRPLNNSGFYSLANLNLNFQYQDIPVFLMVGLNEYNLLLQRVDLIYKILVSKNMNVTYLKYPYNKRAFWKPNFKYMVDIFKFIEDNSKNAR